MSKDKVTNREMILTIGIMNKIQSILFLSISLFAFSSYAFECKGYKANEQERSLAFIAIEENAYKFGLDFHGAYPNLAASAESLESLETFLLKNYTGGYYKTVNPLLRTGEPLGDQENLLKVLCSGLANLNNFEGAVFRAAKLPKQIKSQYKKDATIIEKGFTSTSMDEAGVKAYLRNSGAESNTFFYIKSKNGKNLSSYSSNQQEREVLFAAGTQFKVTKTSFTLFGVKRVWMEEI